MKELLAFLVEKITGTTDFEIDELDEDNRLTYYIKAKPDIVGLIIGKQGKTIKSLRKILSIRATVEDKSVNISVTEA